MIHFDTIQEFNDMLGVETQHLSDAERETFVTCLHQIQSEIGHTIDRLSRSLITSYIGILLNYCQRFYERQFETRHEQNHDLLVRFERLLNRYFEGRNAMQNGLPTVRYCASELCLSPNYFGDLIKKETGRSAQEHIKLKTLDIVKERLADQSKSISEVSYELGFQYPQHLSRFFKKEAGMTPAEYRMRIA